MQAGSNNARGNKGDGFIELDSIDKPRIAGSEAPNDRRGPKSIEYSNDEQRLGSVAPTSPAYRAEKFKAIGAIPGRRHGRRYQSRRRRYG